MKAMTGRERVLTALNHQEPDRVPLDLGSTRATVIVAGAYEKLKSHLNLDSETTFMDRVSGRVLPHTRILNQFAIDTRMLPLKPPFRWAEGLQLSESYTDEWGVFWRLTSDGRYYVGNPPFAGSSSLSDLKAHRWPDPDALKLTEGLRARARTLRQRTNSAIVLGLPGRVFSLGQNLCGFEDWLVNLIAHPGFTGALLDRVVEIQSQMIKNILQVVGANVDVVLCPDDLGMQNAPLISPALYRQMIKPRQKKLFATIKRYTDAKLLLHSDGAIVPLIGDFIDIGVDVLNPVQVSAAWMEDTGWLKKTFGKDLAFWGAVDTQRVLPFGTPQMVKEEVKKRIQDLAPGGGYVLASVHNIQAEVPPENICAMFEAGLEYGSYASGINN